MSRAVSDSVNRWLRENKKPFTGKIVSVEEIAQINEKKFVEILSPMGAKFLIGPGYMLYESPRRYDMEKLYWAGKNPGLEESAGLVRRSTGRVRPNGGVYPWEKGWDEENPSS